MSFMENNVTYRTQKIGVYEIKCGLRKTWTTIGLQEEEKIGVKSKNWLLGI